MVYDSRVVQGALARMQETNDQAFVPVSFAFESFEYARYYGSMTYFSGTYKYLVREPVYFSGTSRQFAELGTVLYLVQGTSSWDTQVLWFCLIVPVKITVITTTTVPKCFMSAQNYLRE